MALCFIFLSSNPFNASRSAERKASGGAPRRPRNPFGDDAPRKPFSGKPRALRTPYGVEPSADDVLITRESDGSYRASGAWIDALVGRVNFNDRESLMYFERSLSKYGIIDKLREAGCEEGDEVWIDDISFEFVN